MEQLQEEYLVKFPHIVFVTYQDMRIFYSKHKYDYKPWFVIIHPDHTIYPQSYCLGTHWGDSKEEVIQWALAEVDEFLAKLYLPLVFTRISVLCHISLRQCNCALLLLLGKVPYLPSQSNL